MAINALGFQQPFDGERPEISQAEQETVSGQFSSLVDDILLSNIGDIQTGIRLFGRSSVYRRIPLESGHVDVTIENNSLGPNKKVVEMVEWRREVRTISVTGLAGEVEKLEIPGVRMGGACKYRIGPDRVVRRADTGDADYERRAEKLRDMVGNLPDTPIAGMVFVASPEAPIVFHYGAYDDPDAQMAEVFGIYNQPISIDEMTKLDELVRQAEAIE